MLSLKQPLPRLNANYSRGELACVADSCGSAVPDNWCMAVGTGEGLGGSVGDNGAGYDRGIVGGARLEGERAGVAAGLLERLWQYASPIVTAAPITIAAIVSVV